ncbi:hypothetical protein L9F63_021180, partial [Diploptera punctata]
IILAVVPAAPVIRFHLFTTLASSYNNPRTHAQTIATRASVLNICHKLRCVKFKIGNRCCQ